MFAGMLLEYIEIQENFSLPWVNSFMTEIRII